MDKPVDMSLVRGVSVIAGVFVLAIILHFVAQQQNDGMPLLLLGIAGVCTGAVVLCLALQPDADGRSFTFPRIAAGVMVSIGCIALTSVLGYMYGGAQDNPAFLVALGFLVPVMFWRDP